MSDPLPQPEGAEPPQLPPPAPLPQSKADYSAVIVGDNQPVPAYVTAASKEALFAETYRQIMAMKRGYCYLFVNGARLLISAPVPAFYVQLANGDLEKMEGTMISAFDPSGRFDVNL